MIEKLPENSFGPISIRSKVATIVRARAEVISTKLGCQAAIRRQGHQIVSALDVDYTLQQVENTVACEL